MRGTCLAPSVHVLSRILTILWIGATAYATSAPPTNKLLKMYEMYYLGLPLAMKQGKTFNDIFPFRIEPNGKETLIAADELESLNRRYEKIRKEWEKRSLLLQPMDAAKGPQVTQHLFHHSIPVHHSALDGLPLEARIKATRSLGMMTGDERADAEQAYFLKSFIQRVDQERLSFFIVSASWCASCKEYRVLLETYLKMFPDAKVTLHSVVIEDPKEQIFESKALKQLFPHPERYSTNSIPRFLALDQRDGKAKVYEEGDALELLYSQYLAQHRGFLAEKLEKTERVAR